MDYIGSHINVNLNFLLNETNPGFVAITVMLWAKITLKIFKNWENVANF